MDGCITEPAQITPALSAHPGRESLSGRAATGREAGAIDPIGASRRCPETSGALESAAGLPKRHQWAGPGSTRRAPARSRRIYMMLYIEEKRGDARPRTLKKDAWVVYQTRSSGTSTTRTARRTRGSTPCLSILEALYDRSCPRWTRGEALLPRAVGGARGRGRRR